MMKDGVRGKGRPVVLASALGVVMAFAAAQGGMEPGKPAKAAFERLKKLEGEWTGRSTKGWDGRLKIQLIAGGNALLELSEIGPHPGETMATAIVPDGDRLLLTHYCIAGNHPRMVATPKSGDGGTFVFEFLDAGNLPSRDVGHMDKAVYQLVDDDHFTSRWTWYENGSEKWMEEVVYERKK